MRDNFFVKNMNTNSCTSGWASDEIFICGNSYEKSPPCQAPIDIYVALMAAIIFLRTCSLIRQIRVWWLREQVRKRQRQIPVAGTTNTVRKKRYPLVAINSSLTICILIIFTITTSLDLVTCQNGSSGPLLYLFYVPTSVSLLAYGRRLMRLGDVLIPLSQAQVNTSPTQDARRIRPDTIVKIFNFFARFGLIIQFVSLLILAPIFPGNFLPLAIGLGSYGVMNILLAFGWAWQQWLLAIAAAGSNNRDRDGGKINSAILQLKLNAVLVFIGIMIPAILFMVCSVQAFPFTWYLFVVLVAIEALMSFLFTLRVRVAASSPTTFAGGNT